MTKYKVLIKSNTGVVYQSNIDDLHIQSYIFFQIIFLFALMQQLIQSLVFVK